MTYTTTAEPCPQQLFSLANIFRRLRWRTSTTPAIPQTENRVTDLLSKVAACALVAASAGFGAVYAWTTGATHGAVLGGLSVLFAVALEICKPLALRNALTALSRFDLIRTGALAILAVTAISYSLTAELSLWSALRADSIASRQSAADTAATAKTQTKRQTELYERVNADLASMLPARTDAEIQADITKLFADNPAAGDCSVMDGKVSRRVCPLVDALKAEAARGKRREELRAELVALAAVRPMTINATTVDADPAASALATYLTFIGIAVPVNVLGEWLALIPVLALEVGSAFAGLLAMPTSRTPSPTTPSKRSVDTIPDTSETPANTPCEDAFGQTAEAFNYASEKLSVPDDPSERLLQLLRTSGGEVFGGQRSFAKAVSISPAHVNGLLHDLKAAGRVTIDVGKNGTRVKLVA